MKSLESIKKEHEKLERELLELETIIAEEEINYPNLIHVFKKLFPLWESHESKEEKFLEENKEKFPQLTTDKLILQHKEFRGHQAVIKNALESKSDLKIKLALDIDGKMLVEKIRKHLNEENDLFQKIQNQT